MSELTVCPAGAASRSLGVRLYRSGSQTDRCKHKTKAWVRKDFCKHNYTQPYESQERLLQTQHIMEQEKLLPTQHTSLVEERLLQTQHTVMSQERNVQTQQSAMGQERSLQTQHTIMGQEILLQTQSRVRIDCYKQNHGSEHIATNTTHNHGSEEIATNKIMG